MPTMRGRWSVRTSEKVSTIAAALYAVHKDLALPKKDTKGQVKGNREYKYLALPGLIEHCHKALRDAQIQVMQEIQGGPGFVEVTTIFWSLAGEWIEVGPTWMGVPNGTDPQSYGSAITYARRYALAAALNLAADEDDDAASAAPTLPRASARATGGASPPDPAPGVSHSDDVIPHSMTPGGEASAIHDLATEEQWERLRAVVGGNAQRALNRLNKANGTRYTKANAEYATKAEVAAAISGGDGE
jgi:hypothetical protein